MKAWWGGGGMSRSKVSIRTLSSLEEAFDKKGKYYELLKIPLYNNMSKGDYYTFLQKNNTNSSDSMEWYRGIPENNYYYYIINYGFRYRKYIDKSFIKSDGGSGYNMFNIFIMNYDE